MFGSRWTLSWDSEKEAVVGGCSRDMEEIEQGL